MTRFVYLLIDEDVHTVVSETLEGIYDYIANSHLKNFRDIVDIETAKERLTKTKGEYCILDLQYDEEFPWEAGKYELHRVEFH